MVASLARVGSRVAKKHADGTEELGQLWFVRSDFSATHVVARDVGEAVEVYYQTIAEIRARGAQQTEVREARLIASSVKRKLVSGRVVVRPGQDGGSRS